MEPNESTTTRVLAFVEGNPGESTRAVGIALSTSESTADYHLRKLAKEGKVVLEASARERRWYAARGGFCPVLRRAMPELRRPEAAAVVRCLSATPSTASEIAAAAGIDVGQARWVAHKLEQTLILQKSRAGWVSLREDADVCRQKALRGEGCDRWGKCPLAAEWSRRLAAASTPKR